MSKCGPDGKITLAPVFITIFAPGPSLVSTHKYKIPSCGISQIDGLEAGTITYEYQSLLVVSKCVKPTFPQQIRW